MLFRSIRFFFLIFSLAFSSSLFAQDNYQQWVDDITARLDKTSQLLQQGNTDDARTEVQMAYFEVFENLEGPIRINFSAQKSYQMEATFGEIRKMIGEGSSQKEIQAKIDQLKKELKEVLPSLVEGHQLNADGQHGVYDNQAIAPYWQQSFKTIDDLIAQGMLIKMVILLTRKNFSNKHNMMAIKTQKWKCPFAKIALQKSQPRLTNSFTTSFV